MIQVLLHLLHRRSRVNILEEVKGCELMWRFVISCPNVMIPGIAKLRHRSVDPRYEHITKGIQVAVDQWIQQSELFKVIEQSVVQHSHTLVKVSPKPLNPLVVHRRASDHAVPFRPPVSYHVLGGYSRVLDQTLLETNRTQCWPDCWWNSADKRSSGYNRLFLHV